MFIAVDKRQKQTTVIGIIQETGRYHFKSLIVMTGRAWGVNMFGKHIAILKYERRKFFEIWSISGTYLGRCVLENRKSSAKYVYSFSMIRLGNSTTVIASYKKERRRHAFCVVGVFTIFVEKRPPVYILKCGKIIIRDKGIDLIFTNSDGDLIIRKGKCYYIFMKRYDYTHRFLLNRMSMPQFGPSWKTYDRIWDSTNRIFIMSFWGWRSRLNFTPFISIGLPDSNLPAYWYPGYRLLPFRIPYRRMRLALGKDGTIIATSFNGNSPLYIIKSLSHNI
jgi:hypothetical protein